MAPLIGTRPHATIPVIIEASGEDRTEAMCIVERGTYAPTECVISLEVGAKHVLLTLRADQLRAALGVAST